MNQTQGVDYAIERATMPSAGRDELRLSSLHDKWAERQPEPPDVMPCDLCADMAEQVDMLRDTVAKQKRLLAELARDIQTAMERLKA